MQLHLIGTSHNTADIEFREKIAVSGDKLPESLDTLIGHGIIQEAVILSTCNRTEIYTVGSSNSELIKPLHEFIGQFFNISRADIRKCFYYFDGGEAVHHLFRVASGLDSMVLGEPQILGQVKDAYHIAKDQQTTGVILNRLFNHALKVGKRVRSDTALGAGAVSVAYAAVELAQKIFKNLSRHSVLLIGAGETGELTAKHLREKGIGKLYITNRTAQKAERLAMDLQAEVVEFSNMQQVFPQVDILIGAANAPNYLVWSKTIEKILARKGTNPLFMIDIGVPRNFDPDINRMESVFLHDIDDLQQIVEGNLKKRRQEIPKAESIITEEVREFRNWKDGLQVKPTIVTLRKKFEEIRQLELQKHRNKVSEAEYEKMDLISRAVLNKVLHEPMVELKKYGNGHPDGFIRIDVIRELFGLENDE